MSLNDSNEENIAQSVSDDAAGILAVAEDRIKKRLLVAEQEVQ